MKKFPHYKQPDSMDCGPTCLRIVSKYHGRNYTVQRLREISGITREGVSLLGISQAAEKIGFRTTGVKLNLDKLLEVEMPCILHWDQVHFVVLYKAPSASGSSKALYYISDPAKDLMVYNEAEFLKHWLSIDEADTKLGVALLLTPSPEFYKKSGDAEPSFDLKYVVRYLAPYKRLIVQLFLGLGVGSLLQLILPFLTQAIVDVGINTRNLGFVYIVVIAQTMLFLGRMSVDVIRSWILLHISTRINISILTDFLIKLMKLPMSFFETKMTGDIMQRMNDQGRIQSFLTGSSLSIVFSLFNLVIFAFVLAYYNIILFLIFLASSVLYSLWIVFFLKKRRTLDFKMFDLYSENQTNIIQLISGIQEIKLSNSEQQKRWEWEHVQAKLFRFKMKILALDQYQQFGAFFIIESKNILITFLVAKLVIDGQLTLGGMMAIQYIVGQLNSPIEQLLHFIQQFQEAKISLERLDEVHTMIDEEPLNTSFSNELPDNKMICLNNVTFSYPGIGNEPVLSNLNMTIPEGKTTAIVGMSGSGKTSILKLLLRFYEPQKGEIKVGGTNLGQIGYRYWRGRCGVVMQDGFIFSDSIARNIAVGDQEPDREKLKNAINIANITEFIQELPLGLNTKIGAAGNGISQGQRQRILIARAVYKNPEYIFFDEATNSLDANNEKVIMGNLKDFFRGRTVVVVAHRLSTVKDADNIILLEKGAIVEQGTHHELIALKGQYYDLVRNQLQLDS